MSFDRVNDYRELLLKQALAGSLWAKRELKRLGEQFNTIERLLFKWKQRTVK